MRNRIFEDFFDDVEIENENDEIEDISNSDSQNCYFKFAYHPRYINLVEYKNSIYDTYIIYKKFKACVDLLSFTNDVDVKIFASEIYYNNETKEKIEIKPTQSKRCVYEFFRKDINPKLSYHVEILFNFNFNKVSYTHFVRDMNNLFLNIKHLKFSYTFELGNVKNDEKYPDIPFMRNISNKMMEDYFKCFCPDGDVNDNSKDIIYNIYSTKFENILNKFIDESNFDIVLKRIERKEYNDYETGITDCIFIHLYCKIPRGQNYQRQVVCVDMRKKLFDFIPRILAANFNICFLITSSKPFIADDTLFGEILKTKNLSKGSLEHVHNMASGSRRDISTFYVFKTLDGSNSKFYMAFLDKDGKLLNGKIRFYRDTRWAYLFQPMQR